MRRRPLPLLAAALGLAGAASPVRADEPVGVGIEWKAAEGCASGGELRERVAGQVSRNAIVDVDLADVVIRGATVGSPGHWTATINVERRDGAELGRRELAETSATCAPLDKALVVVLAMMVDSSMVDDARQPSPAPPPAPPPAPTPAPAPAPAPGWSMAASAAAQTELGRLPGTGGGIEAAIDVTPPGLWPVEVAVGAWLQTSAATMDGGSDFRYLSAAVLTCPLRMRRRLLLAVCAGVHGGMMTATGFGFRDNRTQREAVVDARIDLRIELPSRGAWFVRAGASAWIPLIRPGFFYETDTGDVELLYEPARVASVYNLGVGVRFR